MNARKLVRPTLLPVEFRPGEILSDVRCVLKLFVCDLLLELLVTDYNTAATADRGRTEVELLSSGETITA